MDPIHQFQIINLFTIGKIGNTEIVDTFPAAFGVYGSRGLITAGTPEGGKAAARARHRRAHPGAGRHGGAGDPR